MKGRHIARFSLACLAGISVIGSLSVSCTSKPGLRASEVAHPPKGAQPDSRTWTPVGAPQASMGTAGDYTKVESSGLKIVGGVMPPGGDAGGATPLLRRHPAHGHVDRRYASVGDRRTVADVSCLPPFDEEVWVIERPGAKAARPNDEVPGCGALMTCLPDQPATQVPVPLKHTDVKANIAGAIASVEVTQQFFNPFSGKIEAVYVFPLPETPPSMTF